MITYHGSYIKLPVMNLKWFSGKVALNPCLVATMNNNYLIQIGGAKMGHCVTRPETGLTNRTCSSSPATLLLKQLELELPCHSLELVTNMTGVCDIYNNNAKKTPACKTSSY